MVTIQIPEGYKLIYKTSTKLPEEPFHSIDAVSTNRVWWKFWLPKYVYQYTILEYIPESYNPCN